MPKWLRDVLFILPLISIASPLFYKFSQSPRLFSPDVFAYNEFAKRLIHSGQLFLPSWGHIDTGLILPPFYPFLIGICQHILGKQQLYIAEYVSTICMLLAVIPIYFLIQKLSNRFISFLSLLIIQINYYFFRYAFTILTEASFILLLSVTLLSIYKMTETKNKLQYWKYALIIGLFSGLLCLSRQIGVIIIPFLLVYSGIQLVFEDRRLTVFKGLILMLLCWAIIFFPYVYSLEKQTGQSFFTQYFRMNERVITTNNDADINRIKEIRSIHGSDYLSRKIKARKMNALTADGSEMLRYISSEKIIDNQSKKKFEKAILNLFSPQKYAINFIRNYRYIFQPIGRWFAPVFTLLFIFSIFSFLKTRNNYNRLIIPSFIYTYIAMLSLISGIIPRYTEILFPFAFCYIVCELYVLINYIGNRYLQISHRKCIVQHVIVVILFFVSHQLMPLQYDNLRMGDKFDESVVIPFRKVISGAPAFCPHPKVQMFGGYFRKMPNDSFLKVSKYAELTGVKWLFVDQSKSMKYEAAFYENAGWYWNENIGFLYPDLVELVVSIPDQKLFLYRFIFH